MHIPWTRRRRVRWWVVRLSAIATLVVCSVAVIQSQEVARRPAALRYPPITQPVEVAKLVAPDPCLGGEFGRSVAIHGSTIVVGAPGNVTQPGQEMAGSAYVFEGHGWSWRYRQTLVGSGSQNGASFGRSVAVWGDTIAVGAEHEDVSGVKNTGSVDVFVRTGDAWVLQQKLSPGDPGVEDHYGHAMALYDDTLVVGTWGCDKVYIFERSGDTWTQVQRLHNSPPRGGNFGVSIALFEKTLVVGSDWSSLAGPNRGGAAFVFPALVIEAVPLDVLKAPLARLRDADIAIFISPSAAQAAAASAAGI